MRPTAFDNNINHTDQCSVMQLCEAMKKRSLAVADAGQMHDSDSVLSYQPIAVQAHSLSTVQQYTIHTVSC